MKTAKLIKDILVSLVKDKITSDSKTYIDISLLESKESDLKDLRSKLTALKNEADTLQNTVLKLEDQNREQIIKNIELQRDRDALLNKSEQLALYVTEMNSKANGQNEYLGPGCSTNLAFSNNR